MRPLNLPVLFGLALFAAPVLAGPAPAPSGPDALPALVAGVVGSGDQLSLELKPAEGAPRSLKIGEVFQDGWVLTALTNTSATLTREGASRTVGLNPTGALAAAAPSGAPTTVRTTGLNIPPGIQAIVDLSDDEVMARLGATRASLDARPTAAGLTRAETLRLSLYQMRYQLMAPEVSRAAQANVAAAQAAGLPARAVASIEGVLAALYPDYADLTMKVRTATYQANLASYQAASTAGPNLVVEEVGRPLPAITASPNIWAMAGRSDSLAVMALVAPPPPPPVGQGVLPALAPPLTPDMVAGLRGLDGQPLGADAQAAILQSNQQQAASRAAALQANAALPPGYGPFGAMAP